MLGTLPADRYWPAQNNHNTSINLHSTRVQLILMWRAHAGPVGIETWGPRCCHSNDSNIGLNSFFLRAENAFWMGNHLLGYQPFMPQTSNIELALLPNYISFDATPQPTSGFQVHEQLRMRTCIS